MEKWLKLSSFDFNVILELITQFAIGFIGAAFFYYLTQHKQPEIVTVNLTGIVDRFVKSEAKSAKSPEVVKLETEKFGKELEGVLHTISSSENVIIMPSEAVISGSKDYTTLLEAKFSHLNEGKQ